MESKHLAELICEFAEKKKGQDIVILDMTKVTDITDYFVLITGASPPQLKAIMNEIQAGIKAADLAPHGAEVLPSSTWNVLDFFDVIVHVMSEEAREFYNLEGLWKDAPKTRHPTTPEAALNPPTADA